MTEGRNLWNSVLVFTTARLAVEEFFSGFILAKFVNKV